MRYYVILVIPFALFFLKILLTNFIIPYHKKKALYLQMKEGQDWPKIEKKHLFLKNLFSGLSGKSTSKLYRCLHFIRNKEFVYGEIDFLSFYGILKKTEPKEGEIFYDLGSGTGKAVFCAALFFKLSKSKGIELLLPLHKKAIFFLKKAKVLEQTLYMTKNKKWPMCPSREGGDLCWYWYGATSKMDSRLREKDRVFFVMYSVEQINNIEFIHDNFLKYDFLDADIIYVAATCLSSGTWDNLIDKLAQLKPGSRIIVATKSIEHPSFQLISQSIELMSWGLCPVRIYKLGSVAETVELSTAPSASLKK